MTRSATLLGAVTVLCASSCGRLGYQIAERDAAYSTPDGEAGFDAGFAVDAGFDGGPSVDGGPTGETDGGATLDSGATGSSIADTWINGLEPTPNGGEPIMVCGRSMGGPLNFPLIRFDLSSISMTSVSSATLRLYQSGFRGSATFTVNVHRVLQEWDEATADWTNPTPSTTWSGGNYTGTASATAAVPLGAIGWYEWDMTDLVNTWLGGQPNYGVQLTFGSVSTGTWVEWTSSEGAAAEHPQLIVE